MAWTKQTKPTLSGTEYGYGTQAYGTTPYGGQAASGDWAKQTKPTDTWTKLTKAS